MGGKSNKLLPILAVAALALLLFVLGRPGKDAAGIAPPRRAPTPDADSAADTVRSLTVKLQQIQAETEGLRTENQKLLQQGPEFTSKLRAEVAEELKRQRNGESQELSRRVDELAKRSSATGPAQPSAFNGTPSLPVNLNGLSLGQPGDLAKDLGRMGSGSPAGGMVWIQPLDHDSAAPAGAVPPAASLLHEGGAAVMV